MAGGLSYDMQTVETSPTGRYLRYSSVLGKGAYKTVYKAFDTEEALEVAWNKLHVDRLSEHDLEKVSNEVSLLRQVNHKNIIHFYDTWRGVDSNGNQSINFITEQMMSGTLKEYLRKAKAIKLKVIRRWCWNILEAVAYLHSQDPPIMHRDLKCDNIFINGHVGEVKIGDLGLSGVKEREKADSVIGTPEFMAPELYEESYTEKVDIYAFGMCLLEIVSMEYPYSECNNMAQIFKKVFSGEKPKAFNMLVDGEFKAVIAACLEREARRPSAVDLLNHPLFKDWERDPGTESNLSLVKGSEAVPLHPAIQPAALGNVPHVNEVIDWSDPLGRNVLVTMKEGEGGSADDQEVSVVAAKENGGIQIGLEVPIDDAVKRVEFTFDPFEDSSQHIAQEMVTEFQLGSDKLVMITEEIERQVKIAKEQREAASRNATPQPASRQADMLKSKAPIPSSSEDSSSLSQTRIAPVLLKSPTPPRESTPPPPSVHHEQHISESTQLQSLQGVQPAEHPQSPGPSISQAAGIPPVLDHSRHVIAQESSEPLAETTANIVPHVSEPLNVHRLDAALAQPSTLPVQEEVSLHAAHQVIEQAIEPVPVPLSGTQRVCHVPAMHSVENTTATQTASPSVPLHTIDITQQGVHHTPVSVTNITPEMHHSDDHLSPSIQAVPPTDISVISSHEQTPVESTNFEEARLADAQSHTGELSSREVLYRDADGPIQISQHAVETMQPLAHALHASHAQDLIASHVQHVLGVDQFSVPHSSQETAAVNATQSDGANSGHTTQMLQVFPPTSSFITPHEQRSTALEFPNGAISPEMPAEVPQMNLSIPSEVPSTPVNNGTVHTSVHEIHQIPSDAIPYPASINKPPPPIVQNYPLEANFRGTSLSGLQTSISDQLNYIGSVEDLRHITTLQRRPTSEPVLHVIPSSTSGNEEDGSRNFSQVSQPVLDVRLPPSRADLELDVPPRPPSAPLTPVSSGVGLSDDHHVSPSDHGGAFPRSEIEVMNNAQPSIARVEMRGRPKSIEVRPAVVISHAEANPRPKSWSRPAIVVVGSGQNDSSRESSKNTSASVVSISSEITRSISTANIPPPSKPSGRGSTPPEQRIVGSVSNSTLGDYATGDQHRLQQTGSPRADGKRTGNWATSTSDEKLSSNSRPRTAGGLSEDEDEEKFNSINLTLMSFCAEGRYEDAVGMLAAGASALFTDYDRRTPLHIAAVNGHHLICSLLIQNGAELNVKDRWGSTPLREAKKCCHRRVVELLLKSGAVDDSTSSVDVLGLELMHYAAKGDLNKVKDKIIAGAPATFKDYDQRTPLHLACTEGHAQVADFLLVNGASHAERDRMGRTPVVDAVKNGHRSVLRVLRQFGADVPRNILDADAELMAQRGIDLIEYAATGKTESVRQFLSLGADPNFGNYDHRTALHLACAEGQLDVVQLLLLRGADVHAVDRWGSSPMDEAEKGGFAEIVEELKRFDVRRAREGGSTVSFEHAVLMNGSESTKKSENENANMEPFNHGITTNISMNSIGVYPDDYMNYNSASGQENSVSSEVLSLSQPQTPMEKPEMQSQSNADTILLQQAYEAHRTGPEKLFRKHSSESVRSSRSSVESAKPRPSIPSFPPTAPGTKSGTGDPGPSKSSTHIVRTRSIGSFVPGSISLDSIPRQAARYGSPVPKIRMKASSHTASPVQVAQPRHYSSDDAKNEELEKKSAVSLIVDGVIDAAVGDVVS